MFLSLKCGRQNAYFKRFYLFLHVMCVKVGAHRGQRENILELKLLVDMRPSHLGQWVRTNFIFSRKVASDLNHWPIFSSNPKFSCQFFCFFLSFQKRLSPIIFRYNHIIYWLHQYSLLIYCVYVYTQMLENNLQKSALSFYVDSGNEIQMFRLGGKCQLVFPYTCT